MNVKTMEGLAGAGTSISLISTPMRAAKEAERKGDTDKMIRALGYAAGIREQADDYSEKASQGMKLDGEMAKEQEKLQQEKLIQARRAQRKDQEQQTEQAKAKNAETEDFDSVQISREGEYQAQMDGLTFPGNPDNVQDVTYDQYKETANAVEATGENIDVTA